MKKKVLLGLFLSLLILHTPVLLYGDTVKLKSGKIIEADIIEKNNDYIKVDIAGIGIKYYLEEIDTINGVSVESSDSLPYGEEFLSDAKRADIKKLLEITGAIKIGQQVSKFMTFQMIETIKRVKPGIPQEIFEALSDEINKVIMEAMNDENGYIELIVKLQHKYYTHDDIKGLIDFHQSDLGKKSIKIMPILMQESLSVGQAWGQSLEPLIKEKVIERLKKEGFDLSI
ncbi:MAG: DUF2059 domain-containing protein [Omnitrophica bacterium]|nr:DUF2059 domain-containing protein [Candidatus Omnitrophota bacterium]